MVKQVGFAVASVAMNTGTGTQNITVDCGGQTPKACEIWATRATSLDTITDGAMLSVGMTDGTNTALISMMSDHNIGAGTHDTGRNVANDGTIVQELATTTEAVTGAASWSSFSADTVTINVTDAPATAILLVVVAYYGEGLRVATGTLTANATQDSSAAVSGLAFRPRWVRFLSMPGGFTPAGSANARISTGYCAFSDTGTISQGCVTSYEDDRPTTNTACGESIRNNRVAQRILVSATGTLTDEGQYEATAVADDGFTIHTRTASNAIQLFWMAFATGRLPCYLGSTGIDTNSATAQGVTSPTWKPQFLLGLGGFATDFNTNEVGAQAVLTTLGATDGTTSRCVGYQSEDGATTSDTASETTQHLFSMPDMGGGIAWSANFTSFDPTGYTLTVDNASSGSRQSLVLAVKAGVDTVPAASHRPIRRHHHLRI